MQGFTRQDAPKFLAFKEAAAHALATNPSLTRLDCLNPVKAVAHSFDTSPVGVSAEAAWCRHLGIAVPHHFGSRGVRDSLLVLFGWLARRGRSVAMPSDVYPVYRQIAATAGVAVSSYRTLPVFDVATVLPTTADALLVTAPLSPLGRDLSGAEVAVLEAWLVSTRTDSSSSTASMTTGMGPTWVG